MEEKGNIGAIIGKRIVQVNENSVDSYRLVAVDHRHSTGNMVRFFIDSGKRSRAAFTLEGIECLVTRGRYLASTPYGRRVEFILTEV